MEPVFLLALAGGGALMGAAMLRRQRGRATVWRRSAEACGVEWIVGGRGVLRGRVARDRSGGPLGVTINGYRRGKSEVGSRITVETSDTDLAGVSLRAETLGTALGKRFGATEVQVGDTWFDAEFFVAGATAPSLAFLDAEMRRLLAELKAASRRLEIGGGRLVIDVREGFRVDLASVLPAALYLALEIARRWPREDETAHRIADNALRDPHIGVRLHNLLVLVREMEMHPVVQETLQAACADPWPEIRLRAAIALGTRGHDVLLELALSPEDDVAAKAIGALGRRLPADRATAILDDARRARRDLTAKACIALLGRIATDAAMTRLTRILSDDRGELRAAAAQALGWSGRGSAEGPLLDALAGPWPEVRLAAVIALGHVGSVAAVLPLKEAAQRDGALAAAVRQSIAAIQSRAAGASPGQVSLAGAEAGQLSLPADTGQVSLPDDEPGRVALGQEERSK